MFAFALGHGFEPALRGFSIAHDISAPAWPAALLSMAVFEVATRVVLVHLRGVRLSSTTAPRVIY